jgi:uncharacterized protein (DUF1697 family)
MLRGVNVSGQNKIKMPELADLYKDLGFTSVQTYIQSGNVIFQAGDQDPVNEISEKIEIAILRKFKYHVPVIIRTKEEMKAVIDANPIIKSDSPSTGKFYITFLKDAPLSSDIEKISHFDYLPDKFVIIGREVYLDCAGGYGTSKLSNTFFENKLKMKATTRNWNTVNKLYELTN